MNEDKDPRDNKEREFPDVLSKIKTTHTLSTTIICEYLKTYRPWVTKYILPYLDKVYLPNGRNYKENKNKKKMSSIDWPYLLYKRGIIPTLEASWYSWYDFKNLLKENLVSITRRTIAVSKTYLIAPEERDNYKNEYQHLLEKRDRLIEENNWSAVKKMNLQLDNLISSYIDDDMYEAIKDCDETRRTETPAVAVPDCEWNYEKFLAVHDMKGYGGIDETIYRRLFTHGAIRLEFNFTSKKNDIGKKIFYYYDPNDSKYNLNDGLGLITLPYNFFVNTILARENN